MSDPVVVRGPEELKALEGKHIGYSDWTEITQERVNLFADATGDHQWIHVDTSRATESPFGGLVAHGFLTLSLLPLFTPQVLAFEGFKLGVNYGLDRVRFPAPVLVGSRIRAGVQIDSVADVPGGLQTVMTVTVEIEGGSKPACVAVSIVRSYL
jgi:acyl dehydratase